jgi:hypothetical protein
MKAFFCTLLLLTGVAMLTGTTALAEDRADVLARYLRVDIASHSTQVMATGLLLTGPDEKAFSSLYQKYQVELAKLTDDRQSLIKDYVKVYKTLTNDQAKELLDRLFEFQEQRLSLLRKYSTDMQKSLPTTLVAKFVQLEMQLHRLMDLQINIDLPQLQ